MTNIRLENLTRIYQDGSSQTVAVNNVSLDIASGELVFLLGPSGCGKTTLLRMIAGLLDVSSGKIFFNNEDVTHLPVDKRNTAMVFQNYALWPHMTVRQNVEFGPKMQGIDKDKRYEIALEQLTRVAMEDYLKRKPNQLSGGQQQRVSLARALAANAACLLLDEPLSNLDAKLRLQMRSELRQLVKAVGTTSIYVTHDQKEALSMADRLAVMDKGQIIQTGTPEEVYNKPASRFVADFMGEANFIDGTVETGSVRTELGSLTVASGECKEKNVTCCIRPENITLLPEQALANTTNLLTAEITSLIYLGDLRQFHCRMANGQEWKVSTLSAQGGLVKIGHQVKLQISPEHIALVPR